MEIDYQGRTTTDKNIPLFNVNLDGSFEQDKSIAIANSMIASNQSTMNASNNLVNTSLRAVKKSRGIGGQQPSQRVQTTLTNYTAKSRGRGVPSHLVSKNKNKVVNISM
jgi:hypothetical protein